MKELSNKSSEWKSQVKVVALLGVACVLVFFANYQFGIKLMGDMANRDFMSLWTGGRAVILGLDPYDPQVWPNLRVQFGSHWVRDPICPFPLWTLAVFVPFSLFPLPVAAVLLTTLSEMGLILAIFLLVNAMGGAQRRSLIFFAVLGAFLSRPFLSALTSGQLTPILMLILASGVVLYARGQSLWAGLLFTFLLLKPNLPVLFLPAVGLLFLARRDWRGIIGLGLGGAGLLAVSWILQPGWLFHWLGVGEKTRVTFGMPTIWGLAFELIGEGQWIPLGTFILVVIATATLLLVVRRRQDWQFGIGLAICSSLLATPYLWNYDQILLLVPALIAFCYARGKRLLRVATWFVVLLVIPWGLFWVANKRAFDSLSVFVTISVIVYLCVSWLGTSRLSSSGVTPARQENKV